MNNRKILDVCLRAVLALVAALLAAVLLMTAVYALPVGPMQKNAKRGLENLQTEGRSYCLSEGYDNTALDGYTDAIMVNNAVYPGKGNALQNALENPRAGDGEDTIASLSDFLEGKEQTETTYARYWHGYLLLLKPLLLVFSLADIRMMDMMLQLLLAAAVLVLSDYRGGAKLALPLGLTVACMNPVTMALSLQLTDVYLLMLLFTGAMLLLETYHKETGWMLFLWLGIATAFFDFLTYPVAALGVVLAVELMQTEETPLQKIKTMLLHSVAWAFGYGGMWAGKWVCASLLTRENVIADAIRVALARSGNVVGDKKVNLLQVVWHNVRQYLNPAVLLVVLFAVVLLGVLFRRKGYTLNVKHLGWLPFGILCLYPVVWYAATQNHAIIHPFLTHRNLAVSIMAAGCAVSVCMEKSKKEGKKQEKSE